MHNTPKSTLRENINELQAQGYEVDYNNNHVTNNTPNTETKWVNPTYKLWGWYSTNKRKASGNHNERSRLYFFGEEYLRGLTYLTVFFLFLPKLYIETIWIPNTNNIINEAPSYFGELLALKFIVLWILINYHSV